MRFAQWVLGGFLVFGLGCGGLVGAVSDLAGLELAVKMGADAEHPADFPAAPPAGGTPVMSVAAVTGADTVNLPDHVDIALDPEADYRTEMVTYQLPPEGLDAALAEARSQVEGAGFHEEALDGVPPEAQVTLFTDGATLFLVIGDPGEGDEATFVLMRVRKVEAPATE